MQGQDQHPVSVGTPIRFRGNSEVGAACSIDTVASKVTRRHVMPEDPITPEPAEPTAVTEPIPAPPVATPPPAAAPPPATPPTAPPAAWPAAAPPVAPPPAAPPVTAQANPYPGAAYPGAAPYGGAPAYPNAPAASRPPSAWRRGPWWGYLVAGLIGLIIGAAVCGGLVAVSDHVGRGDDHGRFQRFDHGGQQWPRQFGPGQRPGGPFNQPGGTNQSTPVPVTPAPTSTS